MIRAGQTITAVQTGETFHFLQTAAETDGKLLQIYMTIAKGGGAKAAPIHVHNKAEERFYIKRGKMRVNLDGKENVVGAGESVIIPPNTPHTWRDAESDEQLEFVVEFEPATQMAELFDTLCYSSQNGLLTEDGKASPMAMIYALHRYPDSMYLAALPVWVQKLLFKLFAPIARRALGEHANRLENPVRTQEMAAVRA